MGVEAGEGRRGWKRRGRGVAFEGEGGDGRV